MNQAVVGSGVVTPVGGVLPAYGPAVYLYDVFTEGSNTALTSHTMNVGPGWTADTGTWTVNATTDKVASDGTGGSRVVSNASQASGVCTLDVTAFVSGGPAQGIVARWSDTSNFLSLLWDSTNVLYIVDRQEDNEVTRASVAKTLSDGVVYEFTMTCNGDSITGVVGGTTVGPVDISFNNTATRWGMRAGVSTYEFDNFKVRALS